MFHLQSRNIRPKIHSHGCSTKYRRWTRRTSWPKEIIIHCCRSQWVLPHYRWWCEWRANGRISRENTPLAQRRVINTHTWCMLLLANSSRWLKGRESSEKDSARHHQKNGTGCRQYKMYASHTSRAYFLMPRVFHSESYSHSNYKGIDKIVVTRRPRWLGTDTEHVAYGVLEIWELAQGAMVTHCYAHRPDFTWPTERQRAREGERHRQRERGGGRGNTKPSRNRGTYKQRTSAFVSLPATTLPPCIALSYCQRSVVKTPEACKGSPLNRPSNGYVI